MLIEPDPRIGGSEVILLNLARGLAQRGHELVLVHQHDGLMITAYDSFVTERIQMSLPGFPRRRPNAIVKCLAGIGRIDRRHSIEVILASNRGFIPIAAWATAVYGTPWCF